MNNNEISLSPNVSIIIPIYGAENYIEKCVRSLFEQTLEDVEFVFVDDCTKDKSIAIIQTLVSKYHIDESKVKILHHEKNMGSAIARHTGLLEAKGEYVLQCDSDDWLEPDMCQCLYNEAMRSNADIVYCKNFRNTQNNETIDHANYQPLHNGIALWNHLVRRSLFENEIIWPVESNGEDRALMLQLFYYASKVVKVNRPLYHYHYRKHENSITGSKSIEACERKCLQLQRNISVIEKFLKREGIEQEYKFDLMFHKFIAKSQLTPLISQKKYRREWRKVYSEINIPILLSSKLGLSFKVLFLMRLLGFSYQRAAEKFDVEKHLVKRAKVVVNSLVHMRMGGV